MVSFSINPRQPLNRNRLNRNRFNLNRPTTILSRKSGLILFLVVSIIFLAIGVYIMAKEYNAQKNWQQMEGEITISEIYRTMSSGSGGSNKPLYGPNLEYKYIFNEKEYLGHCCDSSSSSISNAQKMIDSNPVGSKVNILVNPKDPYDSLLKGGANPFRFANLLWVGSCLLFIIIGIIALLQKDTPPVLPPNDNHNQTISEANQK